MGVVAGVAPFPAVIVLGGAVIAAGDDAQLLPDRVPRLDRAERDRVQTVDDSRRIAEQINHDRWPAGDRDRIAAVVHAVDPLRLAWDDRVRQAQLTDPPVTFGEPGGAEEPLTLVIGGAHVAGAP